MVKNEGDRLERVVLCPPKSEYFSVENAAEHNILEVADKAAAKEQHEKLRSAYKILAQKLSI